MRKGHALSSSTDGTGKQKVSMLYELKCCLIVFTHCVAVAATLLAYAIQLDEGTVEEVKKLLGSELNY